MNEKLLKAIRTDTLFNFIANNGYELTKNELVELSKELIFLLRGNYQTHQHPKEAMKNLAEEIEEDLKEYTTIFEE